MIIELTLQDGNKVYVNSHCIQYFTHSSAHAAPAKTHICLRDEIVLEVMELPLTVDRKLNLWNAAA